MTPDQLEKKHWFSGNVRSEIIIRQIKFFIVAVLQTLRRDVLVHVKGGEPFEEFLSNWGPNRHFETRQRSWEILKKIWEDFSSREPRSATSIL